MVLVPLIDIALEQIPIVEINRGEGVPTDFWRVLRAEWGSALYGSNHRIRIPVDRFVARRMRLRDACRRFRVGITWNDRARSLFRVLEEEQHAFQHTMDGKSEPEVTRISELKSSRYHRELRSFQVRDLSELLSLRHGANFSVPGAGKTAVTYALYELERIAGTVDQLLVVCPVSAFTPWSDEAAICFQDVPVIQRLGDGEIASECEVLLVNYQRVAPAYNKLAEWLSRRPTHMVLDEAHRIKRGWAGQWGSACLGLAYLAKRRDVLTGTPAPNSISDLAATFEFSWPGQGGKVIPKTGRLAENKNSLAKSVSKRIAPLFVRTTKKELKLPRVTFDARIVPLTPIHADIYSALINQYSGKFGLPRRDKYDLLELGHVVMYLLEAATNPALLTAGSSRSDPIQFRHPPLQLDETASLRELLAAYSSYETPAKLIEVSRIVRDNAARASKTLIWSNFVRNIESMRRLLEPYGPAVIHGGIPIEPSDNDSQTRDDELRRFKFDADCQVLIANPAATAESISLHDVCHHAVYVDRTFNAGQYLQSLDRIHRLGLKPGQDTTITLLIAEGTIDEIVDTRLAQKVKRLGEVLNDEAVAEMALPDEDDYGPAVEGSADLDALFGHLSPRN